MTETHRTRVSFIPVDADGQEVELPDEQWLQGGEVLNVPAVGDALVLNDDLWAVVRRTWSIPVPHLGARTPRQMVTLHVRRDTP